MCRCVRKEIHAFVAMTNGLSFPTAAVGSAGHVCQSRNACPGPVWSCWAGAVSSRSCPTFSSSTCRIEPGIGPMRPVSGVIRTETDPLRISSGTYTGGRASGPGRARTIPYRIRCNRSSSRTNSRCTRLAISSGSTASRCLRQSCPCRRARLLVPHTLRYQIWNEQNRQLIVNKLTLYDFTALPNYRFNFLRLYNTAAHHALFDYKNIQS